MTALALQAVTPLVFIVFLMATDALCWRLDLRLHPIFMASSTFDSFVPTRQLESGPGIVSEVPELPVSYTVAVLALGAQSAPVHVVERMAGVTGRGCLVLIELSRMATLAGSGSVFAL